MLEVKKTKKYGRGVYATRDIATGELVEASPVLILDAWEANRLNPTILNCYVFEWDNFDKSAIALGFGSLFNHSTKENLTYSNNYKNKTIEYMALCDIRKGEQLFIDYGYTIKEALEVTKTNREAAIKHEQNGNT